MHVRVFVRRANVVVFGEESAGQVPTRGVNGSAEEGRGVA